MKYEYKLQRASQPSIAAEQLNELGSQGWMLQALYPHPDEEHAWIYIFMRAKLND